MMMMMRVKRSQGLEAGQEVGMMLHQVCELVGDRKVERLKICKKKS